MFKKQISKLGRDNYRNVLTISLSYRVQLIAV